MNDKICKRCLMDTSDPLITFDENGVCRHCDDFDLQSKFRLVNEKNRESSLLKLAANINKTPKNRDFNCLIGVSGGVDSTYVAYYVKEVLGLKPLAIHVDNGWNSNLANENIEKTLKKLRIPLKTVVLNWAEFSDLQLAFLEAGTPDGEIPTDHAINAVLFEEARSNKIKYIINGMNYHSEAMKVVDWAYGHSDWRYIKSVYKKVANRKLKKYPHFSLIDLALNFFFYRIKVVSILNYLDFNKNDALETIERELSYTKYESKHYESIYTKWFQGFYLLKKFGIDKRRGHVSDLIRTNQLSRNEAEKILEEPPLDDEVTREITSYVLKKFRKDKGWLDGLISSSNRTFRDYPNNFEKIEVLKRFYNVLRKKKIVSV